MTGHKAFAELRQQISAERRARNAEATQHLLHEIALNELPQMPAKSQDDLVEEARRRGEDKAASEASQERVFLADIWALRRLSVVGRRGRDFQVARAK
jgi:hypothetical protein